MAIQPNLTSWTKFFGMIGFSGVICIPVFFEHTVQIITKKSSKLKLIIYYFLSTLFIILTFTETLYIYTYKFGSFYYYHYKYLMLNIAQICFWIFMVTTSHFKLYRFYNETDINNKNDLWFLFLAIIGFSGGITNYIAIFDFNAYPYGNFLIPIHSIFITYALLRHRMFEIKSFYKKGTVYTLLTLLISTFYILTVLIFERFFQDFFGYQSRTINILTAFTLGVVFFPLRNKIQNFVDRYFFKGTQEEILLQNEQLRQTITESEKYKTLSTLSSGIAHEIKNPLTAIKTFCEYLPEKMDDKIFLRKFSKIVNKEVNRIDHMVHQMIDYSKPNPLALKQANIHQHIEDTINFLDSQLISKNIAVSTQYFDQTNILIPLDVNRFKQAFLNILLNAIDAVDDRGAITIQTQINNDKFIIKTKDTGAGIPKEDLKRIFDPFFTLKDSGSGLGLSITKTIIEQHGGSIQIKSEINSGTTIIIQLPIID